MRSSLHTPLLMARDDEPLATESAALTRLLRWLGPWSVYLLICAVPLAFIIAIYGVVPLGNPNARNIGEQAVLLFVVTPALFTALAYAYSSIFFAGIDATRPFRASLVVLGLVWAAELAILAYVAFGECIILHHVLIPLFL